MGFSCLKTNANYIGLTRKGKANVATKAYLGLGYDVGHLA